MLGIWGCLEGDPATQSRAFGRDSIVEEDAADGLLITASDRLETCRLCLEEELIDVPVAELDCDPGGEFIPVLLLAAFLLACVFCTRKASKLMVPGCDSALLLEETGGFILVLGSWSGTRSGVRGAKSSEWLHPGLRGDEIDAFVVMSPVIAP